MVDPITQGRRLMEVSRGIRNDTGSDLPMCVYLVSSSGGLTLIRGLDVGFTPQQRNAELRKLLAQHASVAVIMIYEAWGMSAPVDTAREAMPARLAGQPGAFEVMIGSVETADGYRQWQATIENNVVGEFIESAGAFAGLLAGLLAPVN